MHRDSSACLFLIWQGTSSWKTVYPGVANITADLFVMRTLVWQVCTVQVGGFMIKYVSNVCEELTDAWQWDLAYESWAWIEDESHWNEYDQMDVWGFSWMRGRKVKNSENS